jgi:UDP-2,3-diacylglucosamine pyrophosphatase LpxH
MLNKTIVVISDLHIGGDDLSEDFECESELINFLDYLDKNYNEVELIILGDFLELWKVQNHGDKQISFIIKNWPNLFNRFKEFGEKHKITVLAGNHDHDIAYNEKFIKDLAEYNMIVDPNQYFIREFNKNGKKVKLVGDHGNQIDPNCSFEAWEMPTNSSLAYHFCQNIVYKIMRIGTKKKRPEWVKDSDNMEIDLIPFWFLSKYFYNELGPMLKGIIIPMLILFGLAVPYFIFDIVTDFYSPQFLLPLINLFDKNIFFKIVIFILYFDMVLVVLLVLLGLIKKDFQKKLHEYGFHNMPETLTRKHKAYLSRAKDFLNGDNELNEDIDIFVNGHTHHPGFYDDLVEGKVYADSGSWKQLMKGIKTRFRFPSVYVPYFHLTYLICDSTEDGVLAELKQWPKEFKPKLTILERIAIKKSKGFPKPVRENTLVKSSMVKFH